MLQIPQNYIHTRSTPFWNKQLRLPEYSNVILIKERARGFTHAFPLCMGRSNISATLMNTVQSLIR